MNKMVKCCLPPFSFKTSFKDTPFHISIKSLRLYLCLQNACWIFSESCIFHHVYEKFSNLWCIDSRHSYSCSPYSNLLSREKLLILPGSIFLKVCFPQKQKAVEETMTCFIKIKTKYEDDSEH